MSIFTRVKIVDDESLESFHVYFRPFWFSFLLKKGWKQEKSFAYFKGNKQKVLEEAIDCAQAKGIRLKLPDELVWEDSNGKFKCRVLDRHSTSDFVLQKKMLVPVFGYFLPWEQLSEHWYVLNYNNGAGSKNFEKERMVETGKRVLSRTRTIWKA